MIKFSLFRIPILVEGWFWLTCVLLGGGFAAQTPEAWIRVAVWALVVFVSVIVHELGHALSGKYFGADPAIKLHGFGGSTFLPAGGFSRVQNILVTAAGPGAGFLLGLIIWGLDRAVRGEPELLTLAIRYGIYVNILWSLLNLLPILPLDGGQILRDLLGTRRKSLTARIGFVTATVLCVWTLSAEYYFSAFMLAMLAYHNFRQEPMEGGVIRG